MGTDLTQWPSMKHSTWACPNSCGPDFQTSPETRQRWHGPAWCPRKRLVTDVVGSVVSLKVEVWSDVVCPWCYIGKRRFEAALARFDHRDEVEPVWRSFELDVSAPPSSVEQGTYAGRLASKYGCSVIEAQAMIDNMTLTAGQEGLDFRFDLARPGNTFDAVSYTHLTLPTILRV